MQDKKDKNEEGKTNKILLKIFDITLALLTLLILNFFFHAALTIIFPKYGLIIFLITVVLEIIFITKWLVLWNAILEKSKLLPISKPPLWRTKG